MTPRQQRFVEEYLIDLNATQAAIRAGYSAKTAEQQGPRLLGNVGVAEAIAKGRVAATERAEITQDMVLRGLLKEATREEEGATHGARVSAWGLLGKFTGMDKSQLIHTGPDGGPVVVKRIERVIVDPKEG